MGTKPLSWIFPSGPLSPPAHGDVGPGSLRAGQALSPVDGTQLPEVDPTIGLTVPCIPVVATGQLEIYPADRAVSESTTSDPGPVSSVTARPRVGDFVHLSGSALSSAFSKVLMATLRIRS